MRSFFRNLLVGLGASLLLAACGGGGSGAQDDWTGDTPSGVPVANAGPAQSVLVGATVTLDGSGSTTPSGTLGYQWTLVSKPEGSTAELANATTIRPTFVADKAGRYEADLVVSNGGATSNHSRVVVTAGSRDPIADGPSTILNELVDGWVQLDGSASAPPAGGDPEGLIYQWAVTDPDGEAVQLFDGSSARPGFIPLKEGLYLAKLVVRYGQRASNEFVISVNVTKANTQPVAHAGGDNGKYTGVRGQGIRLDASQSSDADGDTLSYRWMLAPYPTNQSHTNMRGSNARIENADSATPTFRADRAGTYAVHLYVFDGTARSQTVTANVTVTKPEGAANTPPVAVMQDYYPLNEAEPSQWGSVYFYSDAYDVDGDKLTYKWEWGDTPAGFQKPDLSSRSGSYNVYFNPVSNGAVIEGHYTMYLTVNDGTADSQRISQTIYVRTGANLRPSAVAKANIPAVLVNTEAWFDGSDSSDPNDDKLGLTYQWTWVDRPSGSQAQLAQPTAARTSFVPDLPGVYTAELLVTDNDGTPSRASEWTGVPARATIMAKTRNNKPVVRFLGVNYNYQTGVSPGFDSDSGVYVYTLGKDVTGSCRTADATLDGSLDNFTVTARAHDPDGDVLFYDILLDQPAGSSLQGSYTGQVSQTNLGNFGVQLCNLTVPGDYKFTLQVSDSFELTDPQTLVVRVQPKPADFSTVKLEQVADKSGLNSPVIGEAGKDAFGSSDYLTSVMRLDIGNYTIWDCTVGGCLPSYQNYANGGALQYYRLTAVGRDYTVGNIETVVRKHYPATDTGGAYYGDFSGSESHRPVLDGLPQVIKAGQSVVFSVRLPPLPARGPAVPGRSGDIYSFETYFQIAELVTTNEQGNVTAGAFRRNQTITVPFAD